MLAHAQTGTCERDRSRDPEPWIAHMHGRTHAHTLYHMHKSLHITYRRATDGFKFAVAVVVAVVVVVGLVASVVLALRPRR